MGKIFGGKSENRTDGHAIGQKFVDKEGKTMIFGHRTEYKNGKLLHWHEDFPNKKFEIRLEGTDGTLYIEHLKRILNQKKR